MLYNKFFYSCFFIFMIIFFLEIFARYGYILFSYETHQKYSRYLKEDEAVDIDLKINGRSAIGDLFKGQKVQLAFFGTSSLFYGVSTEASWPGLLKRLSNNKIHIDNYGFPCELTQTLRERLDNQCRLRKFYDAVFIQFSNIVYPFEDDEGCPPHFHYTDRFKPSNKKFLESYQHLKKWYDSGQNVIPWFYFFRKPPYNSHYYEIDEIVYEKRKYLHLDHLFVDHVKEINKERVKFEASLIPEIINKVYCLSDTVFWATEPFLWSENLLESYKDIYWSLMRIETKNNFFLFANEDSIGKYMTKKNKVFKNIIKKNKRHNKDIIFIDLFELTQKELSSKTPNLFLDEYHLSEQGHKLMLHFTLPYLIKHSPEIRKAMNSQTEKFQ